VAVIHGAVCYVVEAQERREASVMLCRTEEGVLAHSLLLTEFTFQSVDVLLSQVIRIWHLSRKLMLTQLTRMYRNSECVAHRGCVGGICNVVIGGIFIVT
jgi:hypothetical protein